jgi:hypothetical protein
MPLVQSVVATTGGLASATRVAGLGPIQEACGFEPLEHVRELMVVAPEAGERGEFGVAFSADLGASALASCAEKAITAGGGEPVTSSRGTFSVVSDDARPRQGRLAVREGGPFLVGRGPWLDAMIDAADGKGPRMRPEHASLRQALVPPGAPPAALVATALLPKALRDQLRSETDAGPAAADPGGSGEGAFDGVLAVGQVAAGVTVQGSPASATQPTGTTEIALELRCDAPRAAESCAQVKQLIEKNRLAISRDFTARLMGLGPLIDTLAVTPQPGSGGGELVVKAHAPTADLGRLLARLFERIEQGEKGEKREEERPPAPPAPPPSPSP